MRGSTPGRDRPRVSAARVVALPALLAASAAAGLVLLVVGASLFDPATNLLTFGAVSLWPVFGPHLALVGLVALAVSIAGGRVWRRAGRIALMVSGAAFAASVLIVASIVLAITRAGGAADPVRAFAIGEMRDGATDASETYLTDAGEPFGALIYRPPPSTHPAPILLYLHGGGWYFGSAGANGADHRWFADRGWLVVSVDYPLASATEATWDRAPRAVACALTWVAQNAPRLGGDANRIVVVGDSAGGNLAVNLAHGAASGQASSACGGAVPIPAAVVPSYPVVDPQDAFDHGLALPGVDPRRFVPWYIGGQPEAFPDRMRAITSSTYLSAAAPATLLVEPERDGLIPTEGVLRWADEVRAAGVDITVVTIPFANHGFDQAAADALGNQGRRSIVERWLAERGLGPAG